MNKKLNTNYFTKTDLLLNIGTGMSIIGAIFLLFGNMISFYLYALSWVVLPVGVVLFIIGASRRSTDKDIEDCIKYKLQSMDLSPFNLGVNERRIVKGREPIIIENYEYENGLHLKISKKGIIFSSKYTKTAIFMLTDALMVITRSVSVVSDEEKNKKFEIPYSAISEVKIVREEKDIDYVDKKFHTVSEKLVIRYNGGYKFATPVHVDINSGDTAKIINKVIAEYKESNPENN